MKTRFSAYEKTLYEFINDIYVVCPKCQNQAIVKSQGFSNEKGEREIKLICVKCGMNKPYSETPMEKWTSERSGIVYEMRNPVFGVNVDPYFKLPLWLQKEMADGLLWAYNYEHLAYIANHVRAELRVRDVVHNHKRSIGARLPKWLTSRKNRTEVLKGIEKMKQKQWKN